MATISGKEYVTPITINVKIPREPLLDVLVEILTPEVSPGDELKYRVTLKNMGETATIEDVVTTYGIISMNENELLLKSSETYAVEERELDHALSLHLPARVDAREASAPQLRRNRCVPERPRHRGPAR